MWSDTGILIAIILLRSDASMSMLRATCVVKERLPWSDFMTIICHNILIEAHRMEALLRHVDEDADEASVVAVTASARNIAHKCNMECLIGYDAIVVMNTIVVETPKQMKHVMSVTAKPAQASLQGAATWQI